MNHQDAAPNAGEGFPTLLEGSDTRTMPFELIIEERGAPRQAQLARISVHSEVRVGGASCQVTLEDADHGYEQFRVRATAAGLVVEDLDPSRRVQGSSRQLDVGRYHVEVGAGDGPQRPEPVRPPEVVDPRTLELHSEDSLQSRVYRERPRLVVYSRARSSVVKVERVFNAIGSNPPRDGILLRQRGVSEHHADLNVRGNGYELCDRDSANGLEVNGQPVHRVYVKPHDVLTIGPLECLFLYDPESDEERGDEVTGEHLLRSGRFSKSQVQAIVQESSLRKVSLPEYLIVEEYLTPLAWRALWCSAQKRRLSWRKWILVAAAGLLVAAVAAGTSLLLWR